MFMYLPNIYSDINYLMSLKVTAMPASEIYYAYLIMTSKWAALFAAMGVLTYRRRYYFFYHQILVLGHFQSNQCPHEKHHVQTNSPKIILQTVSNPSNFRSSSHYRHQNCQWVYWRIRLHGIERNLLSRWRCMLPPLYITLPQLYCCWHHVFVQPLVQRPKSNP